LVVLNNKEMFIGVDGGGTKTIVLVADKDGKVVCREKGENTNFYVSGIEKARNNLQVILDRVYRCINKNDVASAFIGMSAIEYEADTKLLDDFTENMFNCPVFMHTDAYVALMGFTYGNPGALLISGTGSIAIAMNSVGKLKVIGGWGYLLGDGGSAYHTALEALRASVKAFDGIGKPTILCDAVMQYFKIEKPHDLVQRFTPGISRPQIALFAKEVTNCAEKGDAVAIDILMAAADELAKIGAAAAKYANCSEIGIYGGVLKNDRFVRENFSRRLQHYLPGVRAVLPQLPPEGGAVISAMRRYGIHVDDRIINNLKETIKHYM
jgi:glucosamine kinase